MLIKLLIIALVCLLLYKLNDNRKKKLDKIVITHSEALAKIRKLNAKYTFAKIPNFDMRHAYDNEIYYDSISTKDYLTYQLIYIGSKVREAIQNTKSNANTYSLYMSEVTAIKDFGKFNIELSDSARRYIEKREHKLFEELIRNETVQFKIKVELSLTKINGVYLDSKSEVYYSETIESILTRLSQKQNGFYLDQDMWDSISRVERGKVSNKLRFAVYQRDGNRCRKCGSTRNLEIDHIFPISKGGKTEFSNLQTLCHRCNSLKSNTIERGTYDSKYDRDAYVCPNCGVGLVLKNGAYGQFYGCPNYPKCKYSKNL